MDNLAILEVHHIVPLKDGGINELENLALLCPNCHAMLHRIISSVNKDTESGMDSWILENYSFNARERLFDIFRRYFKMKP